MTSSIKNPLDLATRDFRYADLIARLGYETEAKRIRNEARGLLEDMPRGKSLIMHISHAAVPRPLDAAEIENRRLESEYSHSDGAHT
mgnify:CR=1 FL=1